MDLLLQLSHFSRPTQATQEDELPECRAKGIHTSCGWCDMCREIREINVPRGVRSLHSSCRTQSGTESCSSSRGVLCHM